MLYDAIVIGAGASGLQLAQGLRLAMKNVLVLEKSRGVGGRLATRRTESCRFDHGAQFYKVAKHEDLHWDRLLVEDSIVQNWFVEQDSQYRVAAGGMTQIAKNWAKGLHILFEKKVLEIKELQPSEDVIYELKVDSGEFFRAKSVFISAPLPQSLELLENSEISFSENLKFIAYAKAVVGLFRVQSGGADFQQLRFVTEVNGQIYSVSNQFSKGVSSHLAFTVVMTPAWSEREFENPDAMILDKITNEFLAFLNTLGSDYQILESELKKWRYSHPLTQYTQLFEQVGSQKQIYLLGDAFGGGSVRGALRSAEAVQSHFLNEFRT